MYGSIIEVKGDTRSLDSLAHVISGGGSFVSEVPKKQQLVRSCGARSFQDFESF